MIIYCKASDIDNVIEKLEQIEERFWLNYKNFDSVNRAYMRDNFETIYKKLDEILSKDQMEMDI